MSANDIIDLLSDEDDSDTNYLKTVTKSQVHSQRRPTVVREIENPEAALANAGSLDTTNQLPQRLETWNTLARSKSAEPLFSATKILKLKNRATSVPMQLANKGTHSVKPPSQIVLNQGERAKHDWNENERLPLKDQNLAGTARLCGNPSLEGSNSGVPAATSAATAESNEQSLAMIKMLAWTSPKPSAGNAAPTLKRKPADAPQNGNKRMRPAPLPSTAQPAPAPMPSTSCSELLWAVPAYRGPDANRKVDILSQCHKASVPDSPCKPVTPSIDSSSSSPSLSNSSSSPPSSVPPPPKPRPTKWTYQQLRNFVSDLGASFPFADFAAQNGKTKIQVVDAFDFLIARPADRFLTDSAGMRIAKRFEEEMKKEKEQLEKVMRAVHEREAMKGHWAAEGMPKKRRIRESTGKSVVGSGRKSLSKEKACSE